MNKIPRQMLCQILAKYGPEVSSDVRRCENLLKDLCGAYRREINVLVTAIEERVPLDLLAAHRSMPLEVLLTRLENRLEEQTALTREAARWAVESWAAALNLITENEIHSRPKQNKPAEPPILQTKIAEPNASAVNTFPKDKRDNSVHTPKIPATVPPPQNNPAVIRPPANPSKPSLPAVFPPVQTPPATQPVNARKGFGLFRGCLLIVFLLAITSVVIFFGVPYAIEVMRETQRERNNEPPRFPNR